MGFLTFGSGLQSSDPYSSTQDKRIILAHPQVEHALILTECESYSPNWENWLTSTDRTLLGSLSLTGRYREPVREITTTWILTGLQLALIEQLKRAIDVTSIPVTLQDRFHPVSYVAGLMLEPNWLPGSPNTNEIGLPSGFIAINVFIDFDSGYAEFLGSDLYQTTFTIKQI